MIRTYEFIWHNCIDGSASTEEIKKQAEHCLWVALMLDEGVKSRVIKITNSDSSPSLTFWEVLDDEAYRKLCEKRGLSPEDFVIEHEPND